MELQFGHDIAQGHETKPPDRRRFPRLKCQLPVEIRSPGSSFPVQGETTDVSLSGCYVATMFPLAVGASVDFRAWVGTTRIACRAAVRTSDPGVGNGIEFLDLDEASTEVLGQHLNGLEAQEGAVNAPTGAIHPHI